MRINHNIPALRTLHQMGRVNNNIDKSMQRLSSGLRINSAADDAAGLAIAQKMDTQVRGLKQANRNAMDGISLIQTAEGALNEVHNMLQRVRELSIQASNGTLTPSDRKAITDEVAQLKSEIDRISEHIEYNERKLLNGEIDRRKFSDKDTAGKVISMSDTVNAGDYTVNIKSPATQTTLVGDIPKDTLYDAATGRVIKGGTININGEQVEIKVGDTEQDVFAKVRNLCDTMGLDISVTGGGTYAKDSQLVIVHREYGEKDINVKGDVSLLEGLGLHGIVDATPTTVTGSAPDGSLYTAGPPKTVALPGGDFTINGEIVSITTGDTEEQVFANIKAVCDKLGIDISVKGGGDYQFDSELIITHRENGAKSITITGTGAGLDILKGLGLDGPTVHNGVLKGVSKGKDVEINALDLQGFPEGRTYKVNGNIITFEGNNGFKLTIEASKTKKDLRTGDFAAGYGMVADALRGDVTFTLLETGPLDLQIGANEGQMMQLRIPNMSTAALGLGELNLKTAAKSQEAITLVDEAIAQVSSARSKLGAYQNRLEHTVANLDVAAENMTASMSRIQDADMAAEMSEFTKDNIISQAGTAMLAQANQRPQQILQLLQR